MEYVGYDPGNVHITMYAAYRHSINTQQTAARMIEGGMTGFHVYRTDDRRLHRRPAGTRFPQ